MRNLIALILLTTSLNAAPRLLSPERPVGDPTPLNNTLVTGPIDIASSPDSIIAAWSDPRLGATRHLFATRLDDQGAALDPYGIPVGYSPLDQELLRVAWDGQRYLFFWSSGDAVWVSTVDNQEKKLFAASAHTTVDYAPGLLLANGDQVTISAIDDQFRITNTQVLDAHGSRARLVRNGGATLAVWIHDRGVPALMAQRVDGGSASGIPLQIGTVSGSDAQIATAPGLLAYADQKTVHVFDVQPNGVITPRVTYKGAGIESIAATSDGGFIAAANRQLRRYDAAGTLVDSISIDGFFKPHLISTHGNVLAVAIGQGPVSYVWRAPQVRTISSIAPVQTQPRLATDTANALLMWQEQIPNDRLFVQLVAASGQPLHDRITLAPSRYGAIPAVGFDGETYVVLRTVPSQDHTAINMQRIGRDGSLLGDEVRIAESKGPVLELVTAGPVVAWIDDSQSIPYAMWTLGPQQTPVIATDAVHLAGATDNSTHMFASISSLGMVQVWTPGGVPIDLGSIWSSHGVAIAGSGNRWLVVYSDRDQLVGQYLQHEGSPAGEPIVIANESASTPRVAWDGDSFVVTWESSALVNIAVMRDRDVEGPLIPLQTGSHQNGDVAFVNGTALLAYTNEDVKTKSSRVSTRSLSRPRVRPIR